MSDELSFTGERFVPGTAGEIWYEHWHRYHFASRWAAGRRVLDVACGEGYGSALLARHAANVVGIDIAQEAIDHARHAYAGVANLEFKRAPCTSLPLADHAVDLAVSFETLEHIEEQERFLDELKRVLSPEGRFVAYQFRSKVRDFGEPVFGTRAETHSGFWNVPPMKIYVWRQVESPA